MSFLSPLLLSLGLAAAIPLLLHLLRRRTGARLDFPAVRYLLRAEQENRRTMRLRNLLLMLLRVATVLLLAIAAAKPVGRWIGAGHAPAAIAIVIDNTLSSGVVVDGRSMLDRYKAAASSIVSAALATDNVWIVTADGVIAGGPQSVLRDVVERLQPTSADADLPAITRRAAGLARAAAQRSRTLVVLTDGQRSTWRSGMPPGDVRTIVWSPRASMPANHAVWFAEARPARWTPRGEVALRLQARDSLTYRVTIGGRTLARGTAAPNEETIVRAAPPERGWMAGSVDLAPDELAADDIRYFAAWIGPAPSARATAAAGEFVPAALDALRASGRLAAGGAVTIGPADEIPALPALITPPTDAVRLGAANRALERLGIPWRFGPRQRGAVSVMSPQLGDVAVADRYELQPQAGASADTLARVGQAPWIVAGPGYVLVASPLDASASTLPLRATFIPWLAGTISDRLSGDPGEVVAAAPGTWVRKPRGVDQLERPDGSIIPVGDSVSVPTAPGVYFFRSGPRRAGAIVVNAPPRESALEHLPAADLGQKFPDATLMSDETPALGSSAFEAASTRSLLPPILFAALVALIGESLLVAGRRRETA